jgi:hypothetical protein
MANKRRWINPFFVIIVAVTGLGLSACAFSEPDPPQSTAVIVCQPPSIEAAVTGHWPIPPECEVTEESSTRK